MTTAFDELERAVLATLETYSNVHRGSGHHSMVTTRLYEEARAVILDHLGLDARDHTVVFCSPLAADACMAQLAPEDGRCLSSDDLGLPLGLRAIVLRRKALRRLRPFQTGGGTARLVGPDWVVPSRGPARFEAGTPAIVCAIAFARALQVTGRHGEDSFRQAWVERTPADVLDDGPLENAEGLDLLARLKAARIGADVRVPTSEGTRPLVNLDNGASTSTFFPVWEAVRRAWRLPPPSRPALAREASAIVAGFLNAPAAEYEVIFTANTTEAMNLAAQNVCLQDPDGCTPVVVNTLLEHNSNELPWRGLAGVTQVRLSIDDDGFIDPSHLDETIAACNAQAGPVRQRVRLVAVSGASNVLGTLSDLAAICRVAHRHGAQVLVDAAQLVAHRGVDMDACGIDFLAFSAHKAYAPFGSGALVARRSLLAFPPDRLARLEASGEENAGGLAGLAKALDLLRRIGLDRIEAEEQALTRHALAGLARIPGLKVHGIASVDDPRLDRRGGVVAFELKGSISYKVASELAERAGIGSRWGCHCAHLLIKRRIGIGPGLQQLQRVIVTLFPRLELPGVARVSFGLCTGTADIDLLVDTLDRIARQGPSRRKALRRQMQVFVDEAVARVYGGRRET